jgi:GH24 family phage-related lysozyme (muramidase)
MKTSQNGIDLIKKFEGCVLHAYKPVPSEPYYTIGYGHYGMGVNPNDKITQEQADEFLVNDLKITEFGVNSLLKVDINQNQFDALVSFSYNLGFSALRSSTLIQLVNQKDFKNASLEFDKWNHSNGKVLAGLTNRRQAEKELFLKPIPATKIIPYRIKHGDTLSEIAVKFHTDETTLLKLNPTITNKHLIFEKQIIKVPN